MSDRLSEAERDALRRKVIGLGERSLRKTHYTVLQQSLRELKEKDRAIRQAYSDVIIAVTGGRLIILGKDELDEAMIARGGEQYQIRDPSGLGEARRHLHEALRDLPVVDDMLIAFSEGITNMIKHANGGIYRFQRDHQRVQILLSDSGPGIDFRQLPKATLMPGFSTKHTLGMGFTLMLELTDRVLLCSDQDGTTLILEKDLVPAERPKEDRLLPHGIW